MKEHNIIIAGFGGQGVLFAGRVVTLAGMLDGLEVSWLPSYGPEMRGGTANCSVCISGRPIGSPLVTSPDILIAMNRPSFEKFIGTVAPGGTVFADASFVPEDMCTRTDIKTHFISFTRIANENDLSGLANIIILGKALKETALSTVDTVKTAIRQSVPQRNRHLILPNVQALELGMTL